MSEVEKLYENAGVEKQYYYFDSADGNTYTWELNENGNDKHNMCFIGKPKIKDRVFTPEKQLELICWLVNNKDSIMITNKPKPINLEVLKESIAYEINLLWQDLTAQERTEIRSILNG